MAWIRWTRLQTGAIAGLLAGMLGGCALAPGQDSVTAIAPQRIDAVAVIGASTSAQVRAALGEPATRIAFDSGVEVWRYVLPGALPGFTARPGQPAPPAEYVLLFDRDGVLRKSRKLAL